ncbi:MAG: thiol peroxidase [Bacteroidetes bacterium]|nr:thiol peroxidase [Bacteroidota bacterium]MBS1940160.1 thiol peroxidase [Bacteroidota bacterium]
MPLPELLGSIPATGTPAPRLRYVKQDRSNAALADLKGKVVVLLSVPSLDTAVCATETRTFNQKAAGLGATVLVVSVDTPFAMKRFCSTEGITNVEPGSDFRFHDMDAWGVRIAEGPMEAATARAVWVIDKEGIIRYHELVPELGQEPDYGAALAAASKLV